MRLKYFVELFERFSYGNSFSPFVSLSFFSRETSRDSMIDAQNIFVLWSKL